MDRFNDGGGWNKTWDHFTDGDPNNPWDNYTDMVANCPIVEKDGYIRSGRAFSRWGMDYEYEPILKVRTPLPLLLISHITLGVRPIQAHDHHFQSLRVPPDLQLHQL